MRVLRRIPLPAHAAEGEFDHAAVDLGRRRLYVAHPTNDAVEVVDLADGRHLRSLAGFTGVAGVWVHPAGTHLVTSNRSEDTVSVVRLPDEREAARLPTGARPNGLALDPGRGRLLVAGVGDPSKGRAATLTFVDLRTLDVEGRLDAPGRTRWGTFHAATDAFYVNVADPPQVLKVSAARPQEAIDRIPVPARGPHGLEQDPDGRRLYIACDDASLVEVDLASRTARRVAELSGPPDVLWLDPARRRLYCAVGDPGVVDVFELGPTRRLEAFPTAAGAHTLTVDPHDGSVIVFLPETHEALVLSSA